jgi:hypothetical protein
MAESLAQQQSRFAAHLRNPAAHPAPAGIEERRLEIYRGLFFRNISGLLAKNFPVLRKLHGQAEWDALVRDFYDEHRAHTPLFPEIPREFLQYLEQRGSRPGDLAFTLELAHYEWVELALDLDTRELDDFTPQPSAGLLEGCPVLSPLAWPLSYRYPVHRIGPDFQPVEPPPEATHLLVYRDRADTVRFMQLNPVSLRLLQLLQEDRGLSGQQALDEIAAELQHPEPARLHEAGAALLADLAARNVILGARPA